MHKISDDSGNTIVVVLAVLIVIIGAAAAGLYVYRHNQKVDTPHASTTSSSNKSQQTSTTVDPVTSWYLYTSPGAHYTVRLPDGWNLTQNCDGPTSELDDYDTGSSDPLATNPGTKALVHHSCFGKDGNPLLSFRWFDFSDSTQDAQETLNNITTDKSLQSKGTFQTDNGQTVSKYYMLVTTPSQNLDQPQPGTYYEYTIKNSSGFAWVFNFYPPGGTDHHNSVEEAVKTLVLN